jgi:hypothetical protein
MPSPTTIYFTLTAKPFVPKLNSKCTDCDHLCNSNKCRYTKNIFNLQNPANHYQTYNHWWRVTRRSGSAQCCVSSKDEVGTCLVLSVYISQRSVCQLYATKWCPIPFMVHMALVCLVSCFRCRSSICFGLLFGMFTVVRGRKRRVKVSCCTW